ncbi:unnamed protein product [Aphanomyces euteiches]
MEVVGQLDENMELYRYDTTEQAREYARRFGGAYADVVTLYTVQPRHPDRPNDCMQIKWFLAKSPMDKLLTRRDFVKLESSSEFQVDGKRGWVRSYRSIELAAVPDMRKELNCIRAYMYDMGFVVMESDRRGYLHMTYLADLDVKGIVPSWANDQTLKFWLHSMLDIDRFMRENRLGRTPFLKKEQLCPLDSRKCCALCRRNFGPLRKRTNCQKCGEVVCRACNRSWNVVVNGLNIQARACVTCSLSNSPVGSRSKSQYSSHVNVSSQRRANLTSTDGWSMEHDESTLDDDDDASSHLSSYVETVLEPPEGTIILYTPSVEQSLSRFRHQVW